MMEAVADFILAHSEGLLAFAAVLSTAHFAWRHKFVRLVAALAALFTVYVLLEVYP